MNITSQPFEDVSIQYLDINNFLLNKIIISYKKCFCICHKIRHVFVLHTPNLKNTRFRKKINNNLCKNPPFSRTDELKGIPKDLQKPPGLNFQWEYFTENSDDVDPWGKSSSKTDYSRKYDLDTTWFFVNRAQLWYQQNNPLVKRIPELNYHPKDLHKNPG